MDSNDPKYFYNRNGIKGARVGQAVADMAKTNQSACTVEEMLEQMGPKFVQDLEDTIEANKSKYKQPFYVLALTKKEFWAVNILRNWFVARQTPPHALDMMFEYPNHTKTLYIVDSNRGNIELAWTLPGKQDCESIAKTPLSYPTELVGYIRDMVDGKLELDSYEHLFK